MNIPYYISKKIENNDNNSETRNTNLIFFSFMPEDTIKILCIKKEVNPKQKKSLAEYYVSQYGHIIGDVIILEISDEEGGKI